MIKAFFNTIVIITGSIAYGQTWTPSNHDISGGAEYFKSMELYGNKLLLTGRVDSVDNLEGNGVFVYNGASFDSLGPGINTSSIIATAHNGVVLIGGSFSNAGPTGADNVVLWDGASYQELGSSTFNYVNSVSSLTSAVLIHDSVYCFAGGFGEDLFIGYNNCIACFDSITGWNNMNGGFDHGVLEHAHSLAVYNNQIIIAGQLPLANGGSTILNSIGRWNGSAWEKLDNGLNGYVSEIIVDTVNNFLFVSGGFNQASGIPANLIARWDGYNWSSLGTGINCEVFSDGMCMYQKDLYIGGCFTDAGGIPLNGLARWDGANWFDVDNGANQGITALEEYQDTLWVAGGFDTISYGGSNIPSYRLAKWHMPANTHCNWLQPVVYVNDQQPIYKDSIVPFYNNNAYATSWNWSVEGTLTSTNYAPTYTFTDTGWHEVQVIVGQDGCVDTASVAVYVEEPVGFLQPEQIEFKVYPNPSSGQFTLDLSEYRNVQLTIRDLLGKVVLDIPITNVKTLVNTSKWAKGTYLLELSTNGQVVGGEKIILK
jgi:hypothetical protein